MMVGYNLYYIPLYQEQTGEEWEAEPVSLHLAYGSQREAEHAKTVLESLYGAGRIEISVSAHTPSLVE